MAAAIAAWAGAAPAAAQSPPAPNGLPAGFVYLADIAPGIRQDLRYFSDRNFLARPAKGYESGECILTRPAAVALARVQERLGPGYALEVLDCYRPVTAVADFATWAADLADQKAKARHFPTIDKARLFEAGFLSRDSRHSRGTAVDVTIIALGTGDVTGRALVAARPCEDHVPAPAHIHDSSAAELDFGTGYDCFHELSATAHPGVGHLARRNRDWLVTEMARAGFRNYAREWWHFELAGAPIGVALDFPVRARPPRLLQPPAPATRSERSEAADRRVP